MPVRATPIDIDLELRATYHQEWVALLGETIVLGAEWHDHRGARRLRPAEASDAMRELLVDIQRGNRREFERQVRTAVADADLLAFADCQIPRVLSALQRLRRDGERVRLGPLEALGPAEVRRRRRWQLRAAARRTAG